MIRWAGVGFIIMGCTALGLALSNELEKRIGLLREIEKMVGMLQGEIRCANATLAESFYHVAGRIKEPFAALLVKMAEHMEGFKGNTIKEIFAEHVDHELKNIGLLPDDLAQLKSLGEQLGYLDAAMQLEALELYREHLREAAEQAAEAYRRKSKMYRYLGFMGGLFLAIIFI